MNVKASFEKVGLLLVAPKTQNSGSLRQTLNDLQFRDIRGGSTVEDILVALETRPPDLLITDADLPDGDVCELITDIRNNLVGSNPFLSVIVTTWEPTETLVRRVVESGADDLLIQPASRGQLRSRIDTLAFNRKPFLVTATYIGPDRRVVPRGGTEGTLPVDVPNLLQAKATGDFDTAALQHAIDSAVASINIDKLSRNVAHVNFLANRICDGYADGRLGREAIGHLQALLCTAHDVLRRLQSTRHTAASKLCQAIIAVTERLEQAHSAPDPRDIKLLPQLVMSIRLALRDLDHTAETASEISDVVSGTLSAASYA